MWDTRVEAFLIVVRLVNFELREKVSEPSFVDLAEYRVLAMALLLRIGESVRILLHIRNSGLFDHLLKCALF